MVTQQEPQCYGWKLLVGAWQRDNHLLGEAAIERSVLLIHVEAWLRDNHLLHEFAVERSVLPFGGLRTINSEVEFGIELLFVCW